MKRTTISISDDLSKLVEDEARRRGTSVSAVIRASVVETLVESRNRQLPFENLFDDPELPPASELESELERLWRDDLARGR
jgi:hypothetical protein